MTKKRSMAFLYPRNYLKKSIIVHAQLVILILSNPKMMST